MIPNFQAYIRQNLKISRLQYPPERVLAHEDGLVDNHEYEDLRGVDPKKLLEGISIEEERIMKISKKARTPEEFERLLEEERGTPISWNLMAIELGVVSLVAAISAFGCAPFSSCRGHPERKDVSPQTAFWSKKREAQKLLALVKQTNNIGLVNLELETYGGALIYAANVLDTINFAKIVERYLNK